MASTALISHSQPFAHSITVRNPFHPHQDRQITAIPGPVPLRALVPEMDQPILVLRNGEAQLRATWDQPVRCGDLIAIIVLPQGGGGGGSNPLRMVLMLAVMVYAPVLASELIGINGAAVLGSMGVTAVQAGVTMLGILRNMKAARQVEAVELMIASNTITVAHAEALLKATPSEQRTDVKPAEREKKTAPIEQIEKLEKEMSQVQEKYQEAESSYGSDLLNLVVAKGYLTKLLANGAVKSYISRHEPEILTHLELVVNTVSMEEAVQQQGQEQPSEATC